MKKLILSLLTLIATPLALLSAPWSSSRKAVTEDQPLIRKKLNYSYPLTKSWMQQLKTKKANVIAFLQAVERNDENTVYNTINSIPFNVRLAAFQIAQKKGYQQLAQEIYMSMKKK